MGLPYQNHRHYFQRACTFTRWDEGSLCREIVGSPAVLHILKWKALQGTLAAPALPDQTLAAGAAWTTCTAGNSCVAKRTDFQWDWKPAGHHVVACSIVSMAAIRSTWREDPVIHRRSLPACLPGTPTVVATGGWPLLVHTGATLTSPVYDGCRRTSSWATRPGRPALSKETGSTTGSCGAGSPPCLGSVTQALGGAMVDGPLVDS